MAATKCQEVAALCHVVKPVSTWARLLKCIIESCFLVKTLPNSIKDMKTVESKSWTKETDHHCQKNVLPLPMQGLHWRQIGHLLCLLGAASQGMLPWISATYLDWNWSAYRTCRNIAMHRYIAVLPPYLPSLNLLDCGTWAYCCWRAKLWLTQKWATWSEPAKLRR
jgi:hypothetical protein